MMRAAVITEPGAPVRVVDDVEVDAPRRGEALVEIEAAGVCGSDLALLTGKMAFPHPFVLGHEAAGRVIDVGPDTDGPAVGSRVVLWMRPPCRTCRQCIRGDSALCERTGEMSAKGILLDGRTSFSRGGQDLYRALGIGAFAQRVVMPTTGLVEVPDDVPTDVAALLGCGVATGAGAILNVAQPTPGDTVLIFGAGGVGLAAAMAASALGAAEVIVADPSAERREHASELGATLAVPGGDRAALREQLGGRPVDIAVDAAGRPELVELGWRTVRQGGAVVAVGVQPSDAQVSFPGPVLALSHRRILGCFMGGIDPQRDIPRLFALYRRGVFPIDRLITSRRPLEEAAVALEDLRDAKGLRTVLMC